MKYKISAVIEAQTTTGKTMYRSTLKDEQGVEETINLFEEVKVGDELDGEIYVNEKGYRNFKSTKKVASANFVNNQKATQIKESMDRKEQSIERFQDDKEFSIMVSSTMRDAVALAIAEYADKTVLDTLPESILKWRKWLIDNWNINRKNISPF